MSGQSAKRLGLEVEDTELELRLRRIEQSLDNKAGANIDAENTGRGKGDVPQVTGLRVTGQTPGATAIAWNAVSIPDLRRYELNFATNLDFSTDLQSFNEAGTTFSFSTASEVGGGGGATWFARVRAVNSSGNRGIWSAVLNLTTGQAQTEDIGDGEVTIPKLDTSSPESIGGALGLPAPPFPSGSPLYNLRVNAGDTAYELYLPPFTKSSASAQITPLFDTSGGEVKAVFNHSLATVPKLVVCNLVNLSAELGYSVGDRLVWSGLYGATGVDRDASMLISSTQVIIYREDAVQTLELVPKGGGAVTVGVDDTKWAWEITVYA